MNEHEKPGNAADDWQSSAEGVQQVLDEAKAKREAHQALLRTKGGDL